MSDVEVSNDVVTTMNEGRSAEVEAQPVVEAVVEPVVAAEPEKELTTHDRLEEVVNKVKAAEKKTATPGKTGEAAVVTPGADAYKPNLKFSVFQGDAKEKKDFEIPKEFQSLIKDKKSEDMVKDLFTKAYGLDSVKASRDEVKKTYDTLHQKNTHIENTVNDLRKTYQSGDIDGFLTKMNISEAKMMAWAVEKAKYYSMSPEERAVIDAQTTNVRQVATLDTHAQTLAQQNADQASQLKSLQLDATLSRPEFSAVANAFDTKIGKPGALRQLAWNHGGMTWVNSKGTIDLTPEQAVQAVMEQYGLKLGAVDAVVATPAATVDQPVPGSMAAVQKKPVTTIPNIKGGQTSPVGKAKHKNIADLKKTYQEKFG